MFCVDFPLTNRGVAAAAEWEQELQAELSDFEMVAGDEAAANWETEADQLLQQ
jgi:broad specificity phosphatase PhoE